MSLITILFIGFWLYVWADVSNSTQLDRTMTKRLFPAEQRIKPPQRETMSFKAGRSVRRWFT